LSTLPPKSRASLHHLGSDVLTKNLLSSNNKKSGTIQSRFRHWINFLQKHNLTFETFQSQNQFSKDYIYACYAEYLIQGHTIKSQNIVYATLINYLKDAGIIKRPHPLLPSLSFQYPPLLRSILQEYKRWQSVPNRRHPITTTMLNSLYKRQSSEHEDSYLSALFDWLVLGIHTGHRKSEWCQDASEFKKSNTISKTVKNTSAAFIAADFRLSSKPSTSSSTNSNHNYLQIMWRFQKNGQNGQIVSFAHNNKNPHLSPVRAAERILQRAARLHQPAHLPLAIYSSKSKSDSKSPPSYLFHTQIEKSLQHLAKNVYNITSTKELKRYSCHSVRVGACVLLHSSGADSLTIKFRLRWRSDSFMEYLRNTPKLAALHSHIVSTTDTDDIHVG